MQAKKLDADTNTYTDKDTEQPPSMRKVRQECNACQAKGKHSATHTHT